MSKKRRASAASLNVQVAVRCRPISQKERDRGAKEVVEIEDQTIAIADPTNPDAEPRIYTFDHAFGTDSQQTNVYDKLGQPVIVNAVTGFNSTIFAYGQTGSGKTHSMMGDVADPGIIPRLNQQLFAELNAKSEGNKNLKFFVTVSYLEIYNEVIKDLLNPSDKQLKIREHPEMGIYVQSLAELVVSSADQLGTLIEQGNRVRQVAATHMNERSSRSHSCFTVKVEQKETQEVTGGVQKEKVLKSKINLVDLAGSERANRTGAMGDRLKEGAAINKSLAALGNVINKLAEGKGHHVPYRNSKLTFLLMESLGGNSKTCMVAAISPADDSYPETLSTLQYAHRAKAIKNVAKINEDLNEKVIRELREEIERMKRLLEKGGAVEGKDGGEGDGEGDGEEHDEEKEKRYEAMQEAIANLERAQAQTWEEKEKIARAFEEERQRSLNDQHHIASMMETVKEEKMEGQRRINKLQQQKRKLVKGMRRGKEEYDKMKVRLKENMAEYKSAMDGAGDASEERLQELLPEIEEKKTKLNAQRNFLTKVKDKLEEVEDRLTAEKVEMAAYSSVVASDELMRKQVEEELRARLEAEFARGQGARVEQLVEARMEERGAAMRAEMRAEVEAEVRAEGEAKGSARKAGAEAGAEMEAKLEAKLEAKWEARLEASIAEVRSGIVEVFTKGSEDQFEREGELEMQLVELRQQNEILSRKLEKSMQVGADMKKKSQQALRDIVACMAKENAAAKKMLQQAIQDAVFLAEENKNLKVRLAEALAYEPGA